MTPKRLEIEGLKSFTDRQTVEFTPLLESGIFAITGETGSGKSTILDAMIIALYGKLNRGEVADALNTSGKSARIAFEFSLGGINYFVERKFKKSKAGTIEAKAELYADGKCIESKQTDVSERIAGLIGLDCKNFCQCVVLEQGGYDRFLSAAPADRRTVIGNIFSLGRYGRELWEKIKARKSRETNAVERLTERRRTYENISDVERDRCAGELARLSGEIEAGGAAAAEAERRLAEARAADTAYKDYAAREAELNRRREAARLAEAALTKAREEESAGAERIRAALDDTEKRREDLQRRHAELIAARGTADEAVRAETELNKTIGDYKRKNTELTAEEDKLTEGAKELARLAAVLSEAVDMLRAAFPHLPDTDFFSGASAAVAELTARKREAEALAPRIREGEKKLAEITAKAAQKRGRLDFCTRQRTELLTRLNKQTEELNAARARYAESVRIDAAGRLKKDLKPGDQCPVCGAEIHALTVNADCGLLRAEAEQEALAAAVKEREDELKDLEKELHGLALELESLDKDGAELKAVLTQDTDKLRGLGDITADPVLLNKILSDWNNANLAENKLRNDYASAEKRKMELSGELAELLEEGKNRRARADELKAALQKVTEGKPLEDEIALAAAGLTRLKAQEEGLRKESEALRTALAKAESDCSAALAAAAALAAGLAPVPEPAAGALAAAEAQAARLRTEQDLRIAERARAEVALKNQTDGLLIVEEIDRDLRAAEKRLALCRELSDVLGSDRLMEFVAEGYIEQFAGLASETLSRLTAGEFELIYNYRAPVSGSGKGYGEYLVKDYRNNCNLRKVSTLSGGETFLASLSLAVAISSLLSRRAGRAPLEFLFIDEGFGTLGNRHINEVLEALNRLKDQFAIGLITHRVEVTQRLERKLTVTKTPAGSRVE